MEPEYDRFNTPIPGESLTDEPGKWSWEQPPQFPSLEEAAEATMKRLFTDQNTKNVIMMLEAGVAVESIARSVVFAGFQAGAYTVDVAIMLTRMVTEAILTIGTVGDVKDIKLSMKSKTESQDNFEIGMADAKFVKFLSEKTQKDLTKIKEIQEKEEQPTASLMARPTEEEDE